MTGPVTQARRSRRWSAAAAAGLGMVLLVAMTTGAAAGPAAGPLVQVSGSSPFGSCTSDAGQSGTLVPDAEVEPWLAADPRDPDHLVAAWQQDRWSNGGSRGLMSGVSRDGGATWSTTVIPGLSLCSGGQLPRTTDPWVSIAANGDVYQAAYSFGATGDAVLVSKSVDGGETWGPPTTISVSFEKNSLNDKESLTTDPTDPNVAYATWSWFSSPNETADDNAFFHAYALRGGVGFSRTTDGGATWEAPRQVFEKMNAAPAFSQIVVLPDGDLVDVFWLERVPYSKPSKTGVENSFSVNAMRSTDKGLTWSKPIEISPRDDVGITDPETGRPVRANGGLDIAVDPLTGRVYAVWTHHLPGTSIDSVALSASDDGGRTWSRAVRVNRTPAAIPEGNQQAFVPSVAVASDGTAAVSYYDFRANDGGPDLRTEMFGAVCPVTADCRQAAAWVERPLTDAPFDFRLAPDTSRGFFLGDYSGLVASGSRFFAAFSMPHPGDAASVFVRSFR